MKNPFLITPEMKSSPSALAEAQAFRKSANLVLRPLASTAAILRGFNRRTSKNRRLAHQTRRDHGKLRGKVRKGNALVKMSSRLALKYNPEAGAAIFSRLYKRLARGICGRFGWKDFNTLAGLSQPMRAGGSPVITPRRSRGRRDLIRANARSHQSRKGLAS
jgi:hypothetical protein